MPRRSTPHMVAPVVCGCSPPVMAAIAIWERNPLPHPLRLLRYLVLAALAATILLPAPAAAASRSVDGTHKMRTAEARLLKDINRIRVRNGRKALRLDKRTSDVARARSSDMAAKRYFAHVEPDGDDARRILSRRDIAATEVTENIGHTFGFTLKKGSTRMATWWYRSAPHRVQMLARDINYIGVGIARRGSRFTYTAIFTRSRDRTRPRVVIDEATWSSDGSNVSIDWHGVDPKLATGTAGIKRFDLERYSPLGGWGSVGGNPQESQRLLLPLEAADQYFRVRAVDKAGNVGRWNYTSVGIRGHLPHLV
jgi:uncharacterized protein YkwD